MTKDEAFTILKIKQNATEKEITAAYRIMAKKWHPDINKTSGATERFKQINNAYDVLCNKTPPTKIFRNQEVNQDFHFEERIFNPFNNANIEDILKTFYTQEKRQDSKHSVILELSLDDNKPETIDQIIKILVENNIKVKGYSTSTRSSFHF